MLAILTWRYLVIMLLTGDIVDESEYNLLQRVLTSVWVQVAKGVVLLFAWVSVGV